MSSTQDTLWPATRQSHVLYPYRHPGARDPCGWLWSFPVGRSGAGPRLPLLFLCFPSRVITVLGCCHREAPLLECCPVVSGVKGTCSCEYRQLWPKSPARTHGEQLVLLMPPHATPVSEHDTSMSGSWAQCSWFLSHCTDERVGGSGCYNDLHVSQASKDPQAGHARIHPWSFGLYCGVVPGFPSPGPAAAAVWSALCLSSTLLFGVGTGAFRSHGHRLRELGWPLSPEGRGCP